MRSDPTPGDGPIDPVDAPRLDAVDQALSGDASSSVVRGAVARGATYAVSTGLIALAFLLVFRDLGVVAFGRLSAAIAIAAIVQSIGDAAVSAVAQRLLVAAPADERPALAAQLVGLRLVLMPLVGLGGVAFGVLAGYPADQVVAVALACLGATLAVGAAAWTTPLVVELRAARASVVELVRQVVIALGLAGAALLGLSLAGYATVYVVAGVAGVVVALALLAPQWRGLALPRAATVRLVVREASWLAVALTVNSLFLKVLVVVASVSATSDETGLFATAARVIEVIAGLPLLMAAVAFPLLSRAAEDRDHVRLARALDRVVRGVVVLVGGAVVVVVVAAEPLIEVFAGAEYLAAAPVLQLQAFALLASTVTQALMWALVALRGERLLALSNALALLVLLVLGAVLLATMGARGGALAAIVGETFLVVATLFVLRRVRPDAVPRLVPLLTVMGLAVVIALTGQLLPWPAVLSAVAAALVYGVAVLVLRLVPRELFDALPLRRRAG
ncbi:lipopolysaccharide biosynthesis protein [Modestobacter sp. SYSU DS0290]